METDSGLGVVLGLKQKNIILFSRIYKKMNWYSTKSDDFYLKYHINDLPVDYHENIYLDGIFANLGDDAIKIAALVDGIFRKVLKAPEKYKIEIKKHLGY